MTDKTTIQISHGAKDELDSRKHENESYDTAVRRLLEDNPAVLFTEDEIRRIAQQEARGVMNRTGGRRR